MTAIPHVAAPVDIRNDPLTRAAYECYRILQFIFVVLPLLAGMDKFLHLLLVDWGKFLSPWFRTVTGDHGSAILIGAAIVEIIIGLGVAIKPRFFGYVAAAWLCAIIVNLLVWGMYYEAVVGDLGLAIAALAMARLARHFDRGMFGGLMASKA